jgi:hypothetical protein
MDHRKQGEHDDQQDNDSEDDPLGGVEQHPRPDPK